MEHLSQQPEAVKVAVHTLVRVPVLLVCLLSSIFPAVFYLSTTMTLFVSSASVDLAHLFSPLFASQPSLFFSPWLVRLMLSGCLVCSPSSSFTSPNTQLTPLSTLFSSTLHHQRHISRCSVTWRQKYVSSLSSFPVSFPFHLFPLYFPPLLILFSIPF